ncbi:MAG: hypothetical protein R3C59_27415 [Planctomycetaceae bacterium]
MQKPFGWIMTILAGLIVLYNVVQHHENERQLNEQPFLTLLSGGENLKPAYTFLPPYTGFEIVVLAVFFIGIVLVITASEKTTK